MVAVGLIFIIVMIIVVLKLVVFRRSCHGRICVASASILVAFSLIIIALRYKLLVKPEYRWFQTESPRRLFLEVLARQQMELS